jgi:hypothetical protein
MIVANLPAARVVLVKYMPRFFHVSTGETASSNSNTVYSGRSRPLTVNYSRKFTTSKERMITASDVLRSLESDGKRVSMDSLDTCSDLGPV